MEVMCIYIANLSSTHQWQSCQDKLQCIHTGSYQTAAQGGIEVAALLSENESTSVPSPLPTMALNIIRLCLLLQL